MGMSVDELKRISPKSFKNKFEGFSKKEQEKWVRARFIALTSGNAPFYKKPLKHKDYKFDFEKSEVTIPTREDTEWMDRHFGRTIDGT